MPTIPYLQDIRQISCFPLAPDQLLKCAWHQYNTCRGRNNLIRLLDLCQYPLLIETEQVTECRVRKRPLLQKEKKTTLNICWILHCLTGWKSIENPVSNKFIPQWISMEEWGKISCLPISSAFQIKKKKKSLPTHTTSVVFQLYVTKQPTEASAFYHC